MVTVVGENVGKAAFEGDEVGVTVGEVESLVGTTVGRGIGGEVGALDVKGLAVGIVLLDGDIDGR